MKKHIFFLFTLIFIVTLSCSKEEVDNSGNNGNNGLDKLPQNFKVDIPNSLSDDGSGKTDKSACGDTICGAELYENLRLFVAIAEGSSDLIEALINAMRIHNINRAMSITFTSDDDGREKSLVVEENVTYNNENYALCMTISDGSNKALQLFWNNSPANGVAILDPYQIDRTNPETQALYQIEYAESTGAYEAQMIVSIADLPINGSDTGAIDNLKMFVGKNGDLLDVYGNTNHPLLGGLFSHDPVNSSGVNYSFVAKVDEMQDISVVELGLPPSTLTNNTDVLTNYAVKNVLLAFLLDAFPAADTSDFEPFIADANAPGYFDNTGFISGGVVPNNGKDYSSISDLSSLFPYIPSEVKDLSISFKN